MVERGQSREQLRPENRAPILSLSQGLRVGARYSAPPIGKHSSEACRRRAQPESVRRQPQTNGEPPRGGLAPSPAGGARASASSARRHQDLCLRRRPYHPSRVCRADSSAGGFRSNQPPDHASPVAAGVGWTHRGPECPGWLRHDSTRPRPSWLRSRKILSWRRRARRPRPRARARGPQGGAQGGGRPVAIISQQGLRARGEAKLDRRPRRAACASGEQMIQGACGRHGAKNARPRVLRVSARARKVGRRAPSSPAKSIRATFDPADECSPAAAALPGQCRGTSANRRGRRVQVRR